MEALVLVVSVDGVMAVDWLEFVDLSLLVSRINAPTMTIRNKNTTIPIIIIFLDPEDFGIPEAGDVNKVVAGVSVVRVGDGVFGIVVSGGVFF